MRGVKGMEAVWLNEEEVEQISNNLLLDVRYLLDRDSNAESCGGAYLKNIIEKLKRHPLIKEGQIAELISKFQRVDVRKNINIGSYRNVRLWECSCEWTGFGTGHDGKLIDGDRCPDCGNYL